MKSGVVPGGSASVAVSAVVRVVPAPATALTTRAAAAAATTTASAVVPTRVEVLGLMRQPSFLGTRGAPPRIVERVTGSTLTPRPRPAQPARPSAGAHYVALTPATIIRSASARYAFSSAAADPRSPARSSSAIARF